MSLGNRLTRLEQSLGDDMAEFYFQELGENGESLDLYTASLTGEEVTRAEAEARPARRKVFITFTEDAPDEWTKELTDDQLVQYITKGAVQRADDLSDAELERIAHENGITL